MLQREQAQLPALETVAEGVRTYLGEKRWRHTCGVRRQAADLARLYGADVYRAELAALLHDFLKETSDAELLQIWTDSVIMNTSAAFLQETAQSGDEMRAENAAVHAQEALRQRSPAAWHGICAAVAAPERFGVYDAQVLSAVDCHTCGKAGMSTLDKILYLADMTSDDRDFPGVEELRVLVRQDLDAAMRHALRRTIVYVTSQGGTVDGESLSALQDLEAKI